VQDLAGKVAVITGGASGIGRSLAEAFAAEGMKLVLADIEPGALADTVADLQADGHQATGVPTDVTDPDSVRQLADEAYATFGAVHVLCNNAGVGPPSAKVWNTTPNDWRWTFGVNVFGAANGVIEFVPRMIDSGEEGIVINTSSPDGPISPMPQASVYAATKSALSTMTECLAAQLEADGANVRAAVFYPSGRGLLDTGLWTSDRNRPDDLAREKPRDTPVMTVADLREKGIPVQPLEELSQMVIDGIRNNTFWMILDPDGRHDSALDERLMLIKRRRNPTVVHELGA
jgi:NAD(P)-dependent dehydrogenase (short-subunit alcohol dehydrogenase family)